MAENAGAAVLALALALIGFGLIVAGVRGTYGEVWQAVKSAPASSGTIGSIGSIGGGGTKPLK